MHAKNNNRYLSTLSAGNIGSFDRTIRFASASLLVGQILWPHGLVDVEAYITLIGTYVMFTALWAWDPLYQLFDFKTLRQENTRQQPQHNIGVTDIVGSSANQANYRNTDREAKIA